MMPTADEVAVAIVAAARETGADPVLVLCGSEAPLDVHQIRDIARARAYAARALDKVFNRPTVQVKRALLAKMVGIAPPTCPSYFSNLSNQPLKWWDIDVANRVINAVMDVPDDETVQSS